MFQRSTSTLQSLRDPTLVKSMIIAMWHSHSRRCMSNISRKYSLLMMVTRSNNSSMKSQQKEITLITTDKLQADMHKVSNKRKKSWTSMDRKSLERWLFRTMILSKPALREESNSISATSMSFTAPIPARSQHLTSSSLTGSKSMWERPTCHRMTLAAKMTLIWACNLRWTASHTVISPPWRPHLGLSEAKHLKTIKNKPNNNADMNFEKSTVKGNRIMIAC